MSEDFETLQKAYYMHLKTIDALNEEISALKAIITGLNGENKTLTQISKVMDDAVILFDEKGIEADDFLAFIASGETDFMDYCKKRDLF